MPERTRVYRVHALVLRRRDYGDADRILTLFTPDRGKLEVIAKGVRKTSSRKAGHLEPFTHDNLLLAQARTWDIVTEAVTVESFRHLREDLDAISRAGYIIELVDAFSASDDDHRPLWDLTLFALRELDDAAAAAAAGADGLNPTIDRRVLLHWYVLHLLSLMGFQPNLFACLSCGRALEPVTNFLNMAEGGLLCPDCADARGHEKGSRPEAGHGLEPLEPDVLKVLRFLQSRPWSEVRKYHVRPARMSTVESVVHRYLMGVLERQLRSVDFLRRIQNDPRFAPQETH
jgi:DNA repair protein RecO (recombination protein O)